MSTAVLVPHKPFRHQVSSALIVGDSGLATVVLGDETLGALLADWPVARLSTISAEGTPHAVPVVFCELGGVIYSPIDGKRKRTSRLKRIDNLTANSRAVLLFDEYSSDWQQLWWVRMDGEADWYEPDPPKAAKIASRLKEKYPQYAAPSLMFDATGFVRFQPDNVVGWAQEELAGAITAALNTAKLIS